MRKTPLEEGQRWLEQAEVEEQPEDEHDNKKCVALHSPTRQAESQANPGEND